MKKVIILSLLCLLVCSGCRFTDSPATTDNSAELEALRQEELISFFQSLPMDYSVVSTEGAQITVSVIGPDFRQLIAALSAGEKDGDLLSAEDWQSIIGQNPDATTEYLLTVSDQQEQTIREAYLERICLEFYIAIVASGEYDFIPPEAMQKGGNAK